MASSSSPVGVRPAQLSDYDAVMELDDSNWGKLDYLPALYPRLLQDPLANCFVATIGDKVMAIGIWTSYLSASQGLQKHIALNGSRSSDVHSFNPDKLRELLTTPEAVKTLFPGTHFNASYHWFPFRCTPANISAMLNTHTVFCSTNNEGTVCSATSFGIVLRRSEGLRYNLYFHAKLEAKCMFLAHAEKHLSNLLKMYCLDDVEYVAFMVEMALDLSDEQELDKYVQMFGEDANMGWRCPSFSMETEIKLV